MDYLLKWQEIQVCSPELKKAQPGYLDALLVLTLCQERTQSNSGWSNSGWSIEDD